ncbi:uncharacterized protein ACO6RY_09317 [Pungitius sinensis]
MGSGISCDDSCALRIYESALQRTCVTPDVGLDLSLLKYSGLNSNAELQTHSNGLAHQVPDFVEKLGTKLGPFTQINNAVGLGALVISIIMNIAVSRSKTDDSYSKFLQAFGEEKASAVRDKVSEYVRRHRMYLNDNRNLQRELQRLETQLSNHLTTLRNSLLLDGQMRSRGFTIWQNGASFHVQMLIHEARLNKMTRISSKDYVHIIQAALTAYEHDLDQLLDKYREHVNSNIKETYIYTGPYPALSPGPTYLKNDIMDCSVKVSYEDGYCWSNGCERKYMDHLFSTYPPLTGLKSQFSNIANNLNIYINQHYSFTLPSARK